MKVPEEVYLRIGEACVVSALAKEVDDMKMQWLSFPMLDILPVSSQNETVLVFMRNPATQTWKMRFELTANIDRPETTCVTLWTYQRKSAPKKQKNSA